jgi:hypothetical protein
VVKQGNTGEKWPLKQIKIYKIIILPVVLNGCGIWCFTFWKKYRLRVFENRVLSRLFRPKRDEVTGDWKKLQNKELHSLYSSPNIFRVIKSRGMRWAGHVARMGDKRNAYKILVGSPEGRGLGRSRRRCEDYIKMCLTEIGSGVVDWIHWAQDRDRWRVLVNTIMNLRFP